MGELIIINFFQKLSILIALVTLDSSKESLNDVTSEIFHGNKR